MSAIVDHYDRLTDEGKITLRQIAAQIVETAANKGGALAGHEWRATYFDDRTFGPNWQVEEAVFIDSIDDLVFSPSMTMYPGSEINAYVEKRLKKDDVWFAERKVTA